MHEDQPCEGTMKQKAEVNIGQAVYEGLLEGLTPSEVQSAIASGVDRYCDEHYWQEIIGQDR